MPLDACSRPAEIAWAVRTGLEARHGLFDRVDHAPSHHFLCPPPVSILDPLPDRADGLAESMVPMMTYETMSMLCAQLAAVATPSEGFWRKQRDEILRSMGSPTRTTWLWIRHRGRVKEAGTLLGFATVSHPSPDEVLASEDDPQPSYILYFQSFVEQQGHARELVRRLRDRYPILYVDSPVPSAVSFWQHLGVQEGIDTR